MKALLTGITGNVGYEVALEFARRGIAVVPCVRRGKKETLSSYPSSFDDILECDLLTEDIPLASTIDCIVHAAGVVHFRDAGDQNARMMERVTTLAKRTRVPVYFVSTAFVYRPAGDDTGFRNGYEKDKSAAEGILRASGVPHGIFRPSVLAGNSRTGELRNFNGFYLVVRAFMAAISAARGKGRMLRVPRMPGASNMVPVDEAARRVGDAVEATRLETLYITNPEPPTSAWVLDETLAFFGVEGQVSVLDLSFEEFGKLDLTEEETALHRLSAHFNPYWSMTYDFPKSLCEKNLIDHEYLTKALSFFERSERSSHG